VSYIIKSNICPENTMWQYIHISCYTYDAFFANLLKATLGLSACSRGHLANLASLAPYLKQDHVSWTLGSVHCITCNYNPSRPQAWNTPSWSDRYL
jgi:hypothetical protein